MICTNCGKEIPNDSTFCLNCGAQQKSSTNDIITDMPSQASAIQATSPDFIQQDFNTENNSIRVSNDAPIIQTKQYIYNLYESVQLINYGRSITETHTSGVADYGYVYANSVTMRNPYWIDEFALKTMALQGQIDYIIRGNEFFFAYEDLISLKNFFDGQEAAAINAAKKREKSNFLTYYFLWLFILIIISISIYFLLS
ncbi:MAG: zinc ribbon domain-containing protein [Eubacteriales bacterium]|nr:zinc ribbon domain-containing protein [Eubacteriales bacterium]